MEGLCQNYAGNLLYLSFKTLNRLPGIIHGCSTRLGGVSSGCFKSLNLGFNTGDKKELIYENYSRLAQGAGIPFKSLTLSRQTHSANILKVDENQKGMGLSKPYAYTDIDGLITNKPGICLIINHGDCIPLLFADSKQKAIGAAHAGWRGTAAGIGPKTVKKIVECYNLKAENIFAAIGPGIGPCCYKVGDEVAHIFRQLPGSGAFLEPLKEGGARLNLALANYYLLLNAGLKEENIQIAGLCTSCNKDLFFSHRRQGGKRGLMASFIYLK